MQFCRICERIHPEMDGCNCLTFLSAYNKRIAMSGRKYWLKYGWKEDLFGLFLLIIAFLAGCGFCALLK